MKNSAVCFFKMRGGSTIAEAAVIFPIIILSIVTAIYLLISLYSQTAASAALHHALLDEAAAESGTSPVSYTHLLVRLHQDSRLKEQ